MTDLRHCEVNRHGTWGWHRLLLEQQEVFGVPTLFGDNDTELLGCLAMLEEPLL